MHLQCRGEGNSSELGGAQWSVSFAGGVERTIEPTHVYLRTKLKHVVLALRTMG